MPAVMARPVTAKMRPNPGESQVSFYARAERALRKKLSRVEDRTARAHELWIANGGERELQSIAQRKFPADKFTRLASRPVFAEHTLRIPRQDANGNVTYHVEKYDRAALQKIVNACNHRILDTSDFAPLTKGHTPGAEAAEQGAPQPDVIGYCGPFRLGLIGNRKPRWAIFQDEWVHNEDVPTARKMSRRSPEVWSDVPMEQRIIDPVAALGAETPRLDLGMSAFHFSRLASGRLVTKYSAAAASPAGCNTSPPSFGGPPKRRYAAGASEMPDPGTDQNQNIDPSIVQAFMSALMQTAPMQYLLQQMERDKAAGDDGTGSMNEPGGDEMPPDEIPQDMPADDVAPDMGDDMGAAEPGMEGDTGYDDSGMDEEPVEQVDEGSPSGDAFADESAAEPVAAAPNDSGEDDMDEEEATHYAAIPPQYRKHYMGGRYAFRKRYEAAAGGGAPSMYSRGRASASVQALQKRVTELEGDLNTFRKNDRYSRRQSELKELVRDFQFDVKQEFAETKDLPADQWETHKKRIRTNYQRKPNPGSVPDLVIPGPQKRPAPAAKSGKTDPQAEKYHRRAMSLINESQRTRGGVVLHYDEALSKAMAEG